MMRQGKCSQTITMNIPILGMLMWMLWSKELTICMICGLVLLWAKQTAESVKAARRERMLKNILGKKQAEEFDGQQSSLYTHRTPIHESEKSCLVMHNEYWVIYKTPWCYTAVRCSIIQWT